MSFPSGRFRSPSKTHSGGIPNRFLQVTVSKTLRQSRVAPAIKPHLPERFRYSPRTLGSIYPATTALFEIGKPAVPDLVEAIANSATSEIARSNAVATVFDIYRSDVTESVQVLMRASKASPDREASMRLYDAARKAADMCRQPGHNSCMSALSESEAHEE
jgi:hypothetical protein